MKTVSNLARKNALLVFFITIISLFTISCKKEPTSNLIVSADTLVFHGNQSLQLTLSIETVSECEFQISHVPDWVNVHPMHGVLRQGSHYTIDIISDVEHLQGGSISDRLVIESTEGTSIVRLVAYIDGNISFTVPETVTFYGQCQTETLTILNTGNVPLNYSITSSSSFVEVSPTSGEVPVNGESIVIINIDREALATNPISPILTVTSGEESKNVLISLEKKLVLPVNVNDIEYSQATDIIVYIGDDCTLNIYHPSNGTTEVVPLFYIPLCVSISPDGTKAAVGHDAHVSYIDLLTKEVINTGEVSCKSNDIVLNDNGWAHVFPASTRRMSIHSINLTDSNPIESLTSHTIYNNDNARLHPSGKYIYLTSYNNIEKFDVQNGPATYIYGKDTKGRKFWFSENGDRIFTSSKYVYKASEAETLDISYNGIIPPPPGETYPDIQGVAQSESKKNLFLILSSYSSSYGDESIYPYVYVHNSDNLIFKNKINLEMYCVVNHDGSQSYFPAWPYYVFSKLDGERIYVITKANGSGLAHEWAIQTISIN